MTTNAYQSLQQLANVGRVRLTPSAISLHPDRHAAYNDTWLPALGAGGLVRLHNCSTGHFCDLTSADVLAVVPDTQAPQDGLRHVKVTLRRPLGMRGAWAGWL